MNKSYRSIWNTALSSWVAVPETARARGGGVSRAGSCCAHAGSALRRTALALALTAAWAMPAAAATLYWDINGNTAGLGGTDAWDTTNVFWNSSATGTGGIVSAWNNANVDSAIFAGTAGTVTLGVPITVGNVSFSTTGYTLTGSTLTLGGPTPTITSNAGVAATISSTLAGTAGLIKAGAGTLTLTGVNTFSGGINVNAGTLSVNANAALGNANNGVVMAGGTTLTSTGALAASRVVTLTSGNVTLSGAGVGSARITGAGALLVQPGVGLNNNANDYTGQTQFTGNLLSSSYSFSSIADLGVASALGAPTTVANGTIVVANGQINPTLSHTGSVARSSNRNWDLRGPPQGGTVTLRNSGSGALTLTGDILISGNAFSATFNASGANLSLLGVISSNAARNAAYTGLGTRTINLGGANTYTGNSTISTVTVQAPVLADLGAISSLGTASGASGVTTINSNGRLSYAGAGASSNRGWILNNGTIRNDGTGALALSGAMTIFNTGTLGGSFSGAANSASGLISGTGQLAVDGAGTWVLTGNNTYTGGTTISAGTLQLGNGGTTGSIAGDVANNGALVFNRSNTISLGGAISGAGSLSQIGSGITTLSGNSGAFSGSSSVTNGALWVNGTLGSAGSTMTVASGGTLGGTGTVGGSVAISDGILAPGNSPGTLTINGDLSLTNASVLDYEFGQAGVVGGAFNDLTVVGGNLTLDGTINLAIPPGGTYGPGLYRVIGYGGTLTDNGLVLGTQPAGSVNLVQTSVAGQVNLINTAGLTLNFWDGATAPRHNGAVNGGDGVWQASAGNINWTESTGAVNTPYADGTFAIFAGLPGTVAVDNSLGAVVSGGMQFAATGYVVQGQPITLAAGSNILRVGDGTAPGAGYVATIASELAGTGGIDKTDLGTLVLTGANSYTGGTTISAGTLQLGNGGTTGSVVGDVTNNGTLAFNRSDDFTFGSVISGSGAVTQLGPNTLTLTGANSYTGVTTVAAGTLRADAANTFSAASAHTVAPGATLDTNGFDQSVAALTNSGTVNLAGAAAGSTLTVHGPYAGNPGILRLGTALAGGTSVSDRLVLDGPAASASGNTTIQIANLGGLGALTTGNGIEVVSGLNGATTTAQASKNAFSLAGGHVDAGAFEYRLYAADAQGTGENWYLRSTTTAAPLPPPAAPATPIPTYRAEVPLLAGLPAQLRQGSLAMLGNLHQRVGDDEVNGRGERRAWGRLIGADIDIRQGGSVSPHSEGRLKGVQAGTDLLADANWRAGIYVGQLDGDVRVDGFARGATGPMGSNDLRNLYLGGYATWTGASGFYADAVLQAGRHRYTVEPLGNLQAFGKASSVLASIEVGQPFKIAERWQIEPQLQLIHQRLSFDDLAILGAQVQQRPDRGWLARVGVRLKGEFATGAGALQPYARMNFYRASGGGDVSRFVGPAASTDIASSTGHSTAELAGGFTLSLNSRVDVYGEAGKLFDIGGDSRVQSGLQGSVGMRVKW